MWSFFKTFFACLLALVIFCLLAFFFFAAVIGGIASKEAPKVKERSVLVLDMGQHYKELKQENPLAVFKGGESDVPGLYDVVRLLRIAETDKKISGIYIVANNNANGFAASEEIRNALLDFKKSGKFILAHGDIITQRAYSVANAADKIYVSPQGYVEWFGYSVDYVF
ncbi:MAG TPA: signal peptide peptidase SppA, partial [Chitinophagaceae bacterium]